MSKRIASEAGINEDPAKKSEDFSIVSPAKKSRKCYTIEYKMKLLKHENTKLTKLSLVTGN